jgi:hypothetical protein
MCYTGVEEKRIPHGGLFNRGGWFAARKLFGEKLPALLEEMNEALEV